MINWNQCVNICGTTEFMKGPTTTLPIAPFPGLGVGALVVQEVYINQGGDGGRCEVRYQAVSEYHAKVLEDKGWTRESIYD